MSARRVTVAVSLTPAQATQLARFTAELCAEVRDKEAANADARKVIAALKELGHGLRRVGYPR